MCPSTSPGSPSRELSVLVGNGLSIAFNPDLELDLIAEEVIAPLEDESEAEADVISAMQNLARRIVPTGGAPERDFELLVGAFESQSQTLGHLRAR